MNEQPPVGESPSARPSGGADPADEADNLPPISLGRRLRSVCSACRQIFGMPDYERYLAHAASTHPGAPVLSRGEYFAKSIERRYGRTAGRCC